MGQTHSKPCFVFRLPLEIQDAIFELVAENDKVAVIRAAPIEAATMTGGQHIDAAREDIVAITSPHPLHRTSKAFRAGYNRTLKRKVRRAEMEKLVVHVEDLNFRYFKWQFLKPGLKRDPLGMSAYLNDATFTIHLTFTEAFLQNPNTTEIEDWLRSAKDDKKQTRPFSFNYKIHPVPNIHVPGLRIFFNNLVMQRLGQPGPELSKLMADINTNFSSGEIYKQGQPLSAPPAFDPSEFLSGLDEMVVDAWYGHQAPF